MTIEARYRLYENPGWGSAIVEAQLAAYGLPYELAEVGDVFQSDPARAALSEINPLAQVPALLLPDGQLMTESAAITLYLADATGSDLLVPGPEAAERADFLRWLIFLVANIYPAVSYFDHAETLLPDPAMAETFRRAVEAQKHALWSLFLEGRRQPSGQWVLGDRFSALDIYLAVMVHWRPGRSWFAAALPELYDIAEAAANRPDLAPVFARNFPL